MKKYSLIITFFITLNSLCQNYKGSIDKLEHDGLHKIILPQKVRSAAKDNFNFLRIKNNQGNSIPYVLIYNTDKKYATFSPIEILLKESIKDSITSIVLENKEGKKQDRITLQVANTSIVKNYNIYGSDDRTNWFGLVANKKLNYINSPNKTAIEKTLSFPLNTYKYLRINFNDKTSLPINILKVGVYESSFFKQTPKEITGYTLKTVQLKEKKITQLSFVSNNSSSINYISFSINTQFYLRNAKIFVMKTRKVKKRIETYKQYITQFKLSSKNKNSFSFSNLNEKEFFIEIENKDNPPLNITNVQLLQKPVYLIANFKKNEASKIIIDTTLSKPSYDLGNFISKTTDVINKANITNFIKIEKQTKIDKKLPFWQTKLFMWICIILGGLSVFYFTMKLLSDINKQES